MPVDTVVDLRQRAGDLAQRLGSLSHFMPAAQELLHIVRRLNSEILLRHNRKVGPETSRPRILVDIYRLNPACEIVTLVEVDTNKFFIP
jgi:hypothetical protein